ncbi:MAG: dihydropteroate synthase [Lachnobacterium sp.]|nr:dihydropteroate synthase [Lachnobacterium sp.]
MKIGNKQFDVENDTYVMGILNVTPDSFSDGGRFNHLDAAIAHTKQMIEEGATIIDVGGESTRLGYTMIPDEEEISRVVPVIRAIKEQFDVPVSIDTYKSAVAEAAIEAGADLVNDIWGLKYDPKMADVIARHGVACCLMHNRDNMDYDDFMGDLLDDLRETVAIAKKAGIADDKIMLDPGVGVGFAKSYENNLVAIREVGRLHELGYPILLGTSRKSVVGLTLDTTKDERVEGTMVTTVYGVQQGCAFVRVHDVKENMRAIRMTQAIMRGYRKNG